MTFLNFVLWALSSLADVVSLVVIRGIAMLFMGAIWLLKIPGSALNVAFKQASEVFKAGIEQLVDIVGDLAMTAASTVFGLFTDALWGTVGLTASAAGGLMEKMRDMIVEMVGVFPEAIDGVKEMIGKVVVGLWEHYKDGVAYVKDNI